MLFGVEKWGIRGTVKLFHSDKTIEFQLKDKNSSLSLDNLVNSVPGLKDNGHFYLNPTLFNGVLQTMYYQQRLDKPDNKVNYGRRVFSFKTGGSATLDYVLPTTKTKKDEQEFEKLAEETFKASWPKQNKGTRFLSQAEIDARLVPSEAEDNQLIILHGLNGGSHEPLIRDMVTTARKTDTFKEITVLNSRGCSRSKITTPELFCAKTTEDLREVIQEINDKFPNRKIFLLGYSFGCTYLINYLAEESNAGRTNNIQLATAVGGPWDLVDSSYHVVESLSGQKIFGPALLYFLGRLVKNNRGELEEYAKKNGIDVSPLPMKTMKTMPDFDEYYTAKLFGFSDAFDYYRKTSPINVINEIRIPFVAFNSFDDPCVSNRLPIRQVKSNPYIVQVTTDLGGHLAFVQPDNLSWINNQVSQLFVTFNEKISKDSQLDDLNYKPLKNHFGL